MRGRTQNDREFETLRVEIQLGIAALERGDAIDLDETELETFLADLGAPTPPSRRRR